jgi:hypothetical protein
MYTFYIYIYMGTTGPYLILVSVFSNVFSILQAPLGDDRTVQAWIFIDFVSILEGPRGDDRTGRRQGPRGDDRTVQAWIFIDFVSILEGGFPPPTRGVPPIPGVPNPRGLTDRHWPLPLALVN